MPSRFWFSKHYNKAYHALCHFIHSFYPLEWEQDASFQAISWSKARGSPFPLFAHSLYGKALYFILRDASNKAIHRVGWKKIATPKF